MKSKSVMKNVLWKEEISAVIEQRLRLQSTQRNLEQEFNLYVPNIRYLKGIVDIYNNLSEAKQNKFITILGGGSNFRKTKNFISKLGGVKHKEMVEN